MNSTIVTASILLPQHHKLSNSGAQCFTIFFEDNMSDDYIKTKLLTVDQLCELAILTSENAQNQIWEYLDITQEAAYKMMAAHVIDMSEKESDTNREFVLMAVATKLLVENFLLNVALNQSDNG